MLNRHYHSLPFAVPHFVLTSCEASISSLLNVFDIFA